MKEKHQKEIVFVASTKHIICMHFTHDKIYKDQCRYINRSSTI